MRTDLTHGVRPADVAAAVHDCDDHDAAREILDPITDDGIVTQRAVETALSDTSKLLATAETRVELARNAYEDAVEAADPVADLPVVRTRIEAFADRLSDNSREAKRWTAFWARQDIPASAALYGRLYLKTGEEPAGLTSPRLRAACLIENSIDDITHGSSLGAADMLASLNIWLDDLSPKLERVIARLLARGFLVYLVSDHGHTEAQGMGNPREGQIAESRGLRARVYRDRALAQEVQADFPDTILWERDGLLPEDAYVLIPRGRKAFTSERERVVTHGGLTLDEMVVPLVRIS
jgi:hypothetical protein